MIDERAHGQLAHELRSAAHMIAVIMRDDQVIDLLHAGAFGGRGDPRSIAHVEPRPAGIH